jgi:hypothetical protein
MINRLMKRIKRRIAIFSFIVSVISCQSGHLPSDKGYKENIHLILNDRYYYHIISEINSHAELSDKKLESSRKIDLDLMYTIVRDSADTIGVKITYDNLHVSINNNGLDKDIVAKSSGESDDPMDKFFGSLLGCSIEVYLNQKGDVLGVVGYNEVSDKILASLALKEGSVKNNIRQQMNKMVGEEFIKGLFQQAFKVFPDKAVYVNDSWSQQGASSQEIKVNMKTIFTLHSISNNIAKIDLRSVLNKTEGGDSINVVGYNVLADLEGGEKGYFDVDTVSGIVINGQCTLSLEGKIQMMGREIPVKITSEKKMEGKKIN